MTRIYKAIVQGTLEDLREALKGTRIIVKIDTFEPDRHDIVLQQIVNHKRRITILHLSTTSGRFCFYPKWRSSKFTLYELANPAFPQNLIDDIQETIKDPDNWQDQ